MACPHLDGLAKTKVEAANTLYDLAGRVYAYCCEQSILCTVENPSNSYFWSASHWQAPTKHCPQHEAVFQNCAYGGERPKWTTLCSNEPTVTSLSRQCPGNHYRAPWGQTVSGQFATALEVERPHELCNAIAAWVLTVLMAKGAIPPPTQLSETSEFLPAAARAVAGIQAKSSKLPPIIPEYASFAYFRAASPNPPIAVGTRVAQPLSDIPQHAKLLSAANCGNGGS